MVIERWGLRIGDAMRTACHPGPALSASVSMMVVTGLSPPWNIPRLAPFGLGWLAAADDALAVPVAQSDVDALVISLFQQEAQSLVRLARLFVDDRNAAEDLVQEAFIRLARAAHRIEDASKAAAYLRSIVLNLARDHNRRGLVSLRHHLPVDDWGSSTEDEIELREDQQDMIEALRDLPHRQRTALVLRYYEELGIDDIAAAMGISRNSVKTPLQRGLAALEERLGDATERVSLRGVTA